MSSGRRKKSFKRILKHKVFRTRNVFSLFCIIFTIVFLVSLFLLNIIPLSYFVLISFIIFLLVVIGIIFVNIHRKKVLKVIGSVLFGLIIIFDLLGLYYIANTDNYLNEKFGNKDLYLKQTYYILSKKDSNYVESDIHGTIGIFQESSHSEKAFSKISDKFSVKGKNFSNLSIMFQDFINGAVDFLLLDQASYDVFFSLSNDYHKNDYTILHEFDLFSKKEKSTATKKDSFQVFVGLKNTTGIMEYAMILSVNRMEKKVLVTNIPNNYYFSVSGRDSVQDSLMYMNLYDQDSLIDSLEELFNISIDYSIILNSEQFSKVIDYLGGISYCSDYEYTTTYSSYRNLSKEGDKVNVNKGCQMIHGKEALAISREVLAFSDGEKTRGENGKKIIESTLNRYIQFKVLTHFNETLNLSKDLFETDISRELFIDLTRDLFFHKDSWISSQQTLTGMPAINLVYHSNLNDQVLIPNESNLLIITENIKKVLTHK